MIFWILAGVGAYAVWYRMSPGMMHEGKDLTDVERRNYDSSMLLDAYRGFGQLTWGSPNDDENMFKKNVLRDMPAIKSDYAKRWTGEEWLLYGKYYGDAKTKVVKKQQFSGPSDEVKTPLVSALSGWYGKATAGNTTPYITRIVPPGSVPL